MWKKIDHNDQVNKASLQLNVTEFVLAELDPECGLAQPQLVYIFSMPAKFQATRTNRKKVMAIRNY